MKNYVQAIAAFLMTSLLISPLQAHHSVPVNFDMKSNISITGILKEASWRNPHSQLVIDVSGDDGKTVTWLVEMNAVNTIRRLAPKLGFTLDDFVVGQKITISGWAGRHDSSVYFRQATFSNGKHIVWESRLNAAEQALPDKPKP